VVAFCLLHFYLTASDRLDIFGIVALSVSPWAEMHESGVHGFYMEDSLG
jgi:hypothetical protein